MTREQLKALALKIPDVMKATSDYAVMSREMGNHMADLIARQNACIEELEAEIEELKQAYIDVQRDY